MLEKHFFNFERRNVLAATDDDFFFTIDNQHVAIFVDSSHVAGVKPPATHHFGGALRLAPIAVHYDVPARHDFADGGAIRRNILVVCIHDAQLHARNGKAGRRLTSVFFFALPVETGLHSCKTEDRRSFGEEAAPPMFTKRRLRKSNFGRSGQLTSAVAMAGTRHMVRTRSCSTRRNTRTVSNRCIITCVPPVKARVCATPQPLAWNNGMVWS